MYCASESIILDVMMLLFEEWLTHERLLLMAKLRRAQAHQNLQRVFVTQWSE